VKHTESFSGNPVKDPEGNHQTVYDDDGIESEAFVVCPDPSTPLITHSSANGTGSTLARI
jgi:hypothetical protein